LIAIMLLPSAPWQAAQTVEAIAWPRAESPTGALAASAASVACAPQVITAHVKANRKRFMIRFSPIECRQCGT
jgi:hypothetical protein